MKLYDSIKQYEPFNRQERYDKEQMLHFIACSKNHLLRENLAGHFTASIWTVNPDWTKTLMVYHNIYDSWSWIGGHADGEEDLRRVALRELREETGIRNAKLVTGEIFSLEILDVAAHMKKGQHVPEHLHFNVTYLAQADEKELLKRNEEENKDVKWFLLDEALEASSEPWMVEHIYRKLIRKQHKEKV